MHAGTTICSASLTSRSMRKMFVHVVWFAIFFKQEWMHGCKFWHFVPCHVSIFGYHRKTVCHWNPSPLCEAHASRLWIRRLCLKFIQLRYAIEHGDHESGSFFCYSLSCNISWIRQTKSLLTLCGVLQYFVPHHWQFD